MKEIRLTKNKVTQVDDEDYEYLNQFKWQAVKGRTGGYYASGIVKLNGTNKKTKMHRLIMETPEGLEVDHNDRDGLNNQKFNLYNCTKSYNMHNTSPRCKSGYKGVYYDRETIAARIKINDRLIYLGCFKTIQEASMAYENAAKIKYSNEKKIS